MTGSQMAFAYIGIMLPPVLFGFLAQALGSGIFSYYLLILFAGLAASMHMLTRSLKKQDNLRRAGHARAFGK